MEFFSVTFAEFCSITHVNAFRLSCMHVSTQVCLSTSMLVYRVHACRHFSLGLLYTTYLQYINGWMLRFFLISVHSEPRLVNTDRYVHVYFTRCRCLILISVWFITRDIGLSFRSTPMFVIWNVPKPRRESTLTLWYYLSALLFSFAILKRSVS